MKLEDLLAKAEQAKALQADLARLDAITGASSLLHGGETLHLTAEQTADFVAWRRGRLHLQLRALGVTPDGAEPSEATYSAPSTASHAPRGEDHGAAARSGAAAHGSRSLTWPEAHAEAKRRLADFDPAQNLGLSRGDAIEQLAQELMEGAAPEAAESCHCGDDATVTIAGQPYCDLHARGVPKPPRPAFMSGHA